VETKLPRLKTVHIRYGLLIASILSTWGIREFHRVAPKIVKATQQIKKAEKIDIHGEIGGCIPVNVKGIL
jgi:hypothetical protein